MQDDNQDRYNQPAPSGMPSNLPPVQPSPANAYTPPPSFSSQPMPGYQPPVAPPEPHHNGSSHNSAGIIVLQWLTYAFWGWTILAMSILTSLVYTSFLTDQDVGGAAPYSIASVLVLLPIAIVCEALYRKKEPAKKTGAASIVMVIHAVIFALFGIGAVITGVFFLVSMFTNAGDKEGQTVGILSALTIAVFYAATFLRTLHPPRIKNLPRLFTLFMAVLVGLIAIMGIIGPVAKDRRTRNDRLIEANFSEITRNISYARTNDRLPANLDELELRSDEAEKVADMLRYTPNTKQSTTSNYGGTTQYSRTDTTYYYELCATFKEKKESDYSYYDRYRNDSDGYDDYPTLYEHKAGENCYKIKTTAY
jgi:hypothetical protein